MQSPGGVPSRSFCAGSPPPFPAPAQNRPSTPWKGRMHEWPPHNSPAHEAKRRPAACVLRNPEPSIPKTRLPLELSFRPPHIATRIQLLFRSLLQQIPNRKVPRLKWLLCFNECVAPYHSSSTSNKLFMQWICKILPIL
jgi:hypothetical protein